MEDTEESHLVILQYSKEFSQLEALKSQLSEYPKYFFVNKINATLVYDKNIIYILRKQSTKVADLGKNYLITQLAYNYQKDIFVFLTAEGTLYVHYIHSKTQFVLRKDCKKIVLFGWIYQIPLLANFFIADQTSIKLMKAQQQKKSFKQYKSINGKYSSFLYDPMTQVLLAFPFGDCKSVYSFQFVEQKQKNNFKGPTIQIDFSTDEYLLKQVETKKCLGIQGSKIGKQIFFKNYSNQQYSMNVLKMNNKSYLIIYFGNQGKLKLYPISQQIMQKQLMIKLPSDSVPDFNVVDDMLMVHLKNQKITFIYDIKGVQIQMLVSPFPLNHIDLKDKNMYCGAFIGKRVILPNGTINKWRVTLPVIHYYLKNQHQIFDFYIRRKKAKMLLLKWLRQSIFILKHLTLSKYWKMIFGKLISNIYKQRDTITLLDIYANIFYPLSQQQLINKQQLLSIILECIRQALQCQLKLPIQIQKLLVQLLLYCQKYQLLVFLTHNDVIKDSQQLAIQLFQKGLDKDEIILKSLGLDMANRVCPQAIMLKLLAKTQQIRQLKRYIKHNFEYIEILHLIYVGKYIQCKNLRNQYLKYIKFFILQKFPSTNPIYLEQAQNTIKQC